MNNIIREIRNELESQADDKTKNNSQRFFKEKVKCYGVKTSIVSKISKQYFIIVKKLDKGKVFKLCEELFASGYCEESWIAANWSHRYGNFTEKDFKIYEYWINNYIDNWAECDTLCNHTVGEFIEKYPQYVNGLKEWAKSKNRWLKRASAVSLIIPARKGKFLQDILDISDILLCDRDDMVQKGYGWMLKEASRKNQKEIFEYVMKNKDDMPRTALRYAIEKMPEDLKRKAMEKQL
ncbi:MAG: DNA alkylation repair protein [Actinomycetota bacterium]|nr:DNA alkylation repair protein [Actinomycetota bacterium]